MVSSEKNLNLLEISTVEAVMELVLKAKIDSVMVIKRIVPVGDASSDFNKQDKQVIFSPEILDNKKHLTIIFIRHELLFHSIYRQEELHIF